jgi:hypothetical protein
MDINQAQWEEVERALDGDTGRSLLIDSPPSPLFADQAEADAHEGPEER